VELLVVFFIFLSLFPAWPGSVNFRLHSLQLTFGPIRFHENCSLHPAWTGFVWVGPDRATDPTGSGLSPAVLRRRR
jgi:hypothetical protein